MNATKRGTLTERGARILGRSVDEQVTYVEYGDDPDLAERVWTLDGEPIGGAVSLTGPTAGIRPDGD